MSIANKKVIKKRLQKVCAICGKAIKVIIYSKSDYRGGHFFGKIPCFTKKAEREAAKAGFRLMKHGNSVWHVYKKDPKPYKYLEYWECPRCYWRGKNTAIPK